MTIKPYTDHYRYTMTIPPGVSFYDECAKKTRLSSGEPPYLSSPTVVAVPAQDGGEILCDRRMFECLLDELDETEAGDAGECARLSEPVLAREWLDDTEEEAWRNFQ